MAWKGWQECSIPGKFYFLHSTHVWNVPVCCKLQWVALELHKPFNGVHKLLTNFINFQPQLWMNLLWACGSCFEMLSQFCATGGVSSGWPCALEWWNCLGWKNPKASPEPGWAPLFPSSSSILIFCGSVLSGGNVWVPSTGSYSQFPFNPGMVWVKGTLKRV